MPEELKIRIKDFKKVEKQLIKLGAKFTKELSVTDTYFELGNEDVLKITEDESGDYLVELHAKNGRFKIKTYEHIANLDAKKEELGKKYGVRCVLKKKRRFFDFKPYGFNINLIDGLGEFLIVEGDRIEQGFIIEKLGIKNPEFIRVSFDKL